MTTPAAPAFANPMALHDMTADQKRGLPSGITSVCSANRFVLEAAMRKASGTARPLLVEATCNQVNQFGGYTGMTPAGFATFLAAVAGEMDFPTSQIILGGDHLGPNPWQNLPAEEAMRNSHDMIRAFVQAGFSKIHLDASMRLAGDPLDRPLDPAVSARRAAELCATAEEAAQGRPLVYVVGTEVPIPGGAQEHETELAVTTPEDAQSALELFKDSFKTHHLEAAWEKVIALVVQPGVEFGNDNLFEYQPSAAVSLVRWIETIPWIVFEAHSTDYQTGDALRRLVQDHFAILKVGPELTFAFREAVFALARMENEYFGGRADVRRSDLVETMDAAMLADPQYWRKYYPGNEAQQAFARKYSFSDRIRYYWPVPAVAAALDRLLENWQREPPPLPLISQYLPVQYRHLREGKIQNTPRHLIWDHIGETLSRYQSACEADNG